MNYYLVKLKNGKVRYFSADTWETVNNRVNFYWNGLCLESFQTREVKIVKVITVEEYEKGTKEKMNVNENIELLEDLLSGFKMGLRYGTSEWSDEYLEDIIEALNEALGAYKEKWED